MTIEWRLTAFIIPTFTLYVSILSQIFWRINLMKFIVSTFNPNKMIIEDNFDLEVRELEEDEFLALCLDAYSCVGYEDVALMLNVAHNKEPVKARIGDVILFADMNKGVLEYSCIRICPPVTPLIREDEYLIEEEMI